MAVLQARERAIVADLGGVESVSAIAAGQVTRHIKLELIETTLWENLQRLGTLSAKGKTRAACRLWLQVVDRLQKSATVLGLARQAKRVPSLQEVMRGDE